MWISGSSTRNFVLGHTLKDFIKIQPTKFESWIMNQGNLFEEKVCNYFSQKYPVKKFNFGRSDSPIKENVAATLQAMKDGEIIIYQGPVSTSLNVGFFGITDFLIRSDYVNRIFNKKILSSEEEHPEGRDFIYYCVDTKYKTLEVTKFGDLTKSKINNSYRTQLLVYNYSLKEMFGFFPEKSFILGRGIKGKTSNTLMSLVAVDWKKDKKMTHSLLKECSEWKEKLNEGGYRWSVSPFPSVKELIPNVVSPYVSKEEMIIAKNIKDARLIHGVTIKDYKNWETCNFEDLKVTKNKSNIVKNFLKVNKIPELNHSYIDFENAKKVFNLEDCIYIDFETISNVFDDFKKFPEIGCKEYIFLIGCTYYENGIRKFKHWLMDDLNETKQIRMIHDFVSWLRKMNKDKLIHWSHAEPSWMKKILERHIELEKYQDFNFNWFDLLQYFKFQGETGESIAFKGMLDFKLKNVVNAMKKLNYLPNDTHETYVEESGLECMLDAMQAYNSGGNSGDFSEIIKYNKADCDSLANIVQFLTRDSKESEDGEDGEESEDEIIGPAKKRIKLHGERM